jgi:hypothetical protein
MKIKIHTAFFKILPLFLFILLPFFISQGNAANTGDKEQLFIAKIVNAYGGKAQIAKVKGISAEGRIKTFFSHDKGSYYRYMQPDRKLYVHIRYAKSAEKRILNGMNGYRGTGGRIEKVLGPPYDAMVYQYNQLDLPFGLIDGSFKILDHRNGDLSGVSMDILKLADRYGYEIEVFVSSRNYHILKVIGYFTVGSNKSSLGAEFMDYKKVKGILLPYKIINYAMDSKISETEITQYTINPKINDTIFNP